MASSLSHIPPEISIAEGHWFRYPIIGEPRYKRTNRCYAKRHPEAEIVFLRRRATDACLAKGTGFGAMMMFGEGRNLRSLFERIISKHIGERTTDED